ncbi:MAG: alpha-hydroxy acid oxidase, partial [Rhodospirillaceae bacterium]
MADKLFTIDDLRARTKARIPKLAFDYLDGGAGTEANVHRNRAGFGDIVLQPEYLRDVTTRDQSVELFGKTYSHPIGVSPVGLANLIWPGTDEILAKMAVARNVPYTLSAVGTTSVERIMEIAPDHGWFQLYITGREEIWIDLVRRAKEAQANVLVVTVDIPVPSKRIRDLRNDFTMPFKMTPRVIWDVVRHYKWALATLAAGQPRFENFVPYLQDAAKGQSLGAAMVLQISPNVAESIIGRIRDMWPGKMVIKGLMSGASAEVAKRIGADGVIVSNHGGRQLDAAPAAIEVLPEVKAAVGKDMAVLFDSGIRTGADIVKAYCLGADYVFSGRSF